MLRRNRPLRIRILDEQLRRAFDAPLARRGACCRTWGPGGFGLGEQTESAGVTLGCVALLQHNNLPVRLAKTRAADEGAFVTLNHGQLVGPFAPAEVAEEVARLHVVFVDARLSHAES